MASAYLSRSISSTGNQKKMTFSAWIKRAGVYATGCLFATGVGGERSMILIESGGRLQFSRYNSNYIWHLATTRLFKDPHGWIHIVCSLDTTQSTAADRAKIYINGEQITVFNTETYPSLNYDDGFNTSGKTQYVGQDSDGLQDWDGGMAHVHYIDGTAYAASTFGQTDATTGIWKPKTSPSVTYGTNGFFLKFDNSANMGLDSSGQSNNLTTTGTIIQNKDTPSNVFATMNPLHFGTPSVSNAPLTNVNSDFSSSEGSGVYPYYYSTLGVSKGKYYVEFKFVNVVSATAGIGSGVADQYHGNNAADYSYYNDGRLYNGGSSESTGYSALSNGDILGCALDLDNNKVYFHINGSYQASGNPVTGAGGKSITAAASNGIGFYHFAVGDSGSTAGTNIQTNFGNGYFGTTAVTSAQSPDDGKGIFEYDVPAGYRALCTESINAQEYS